MTTKSAFSVLFVFSLLAAMSTYAGGHGEKRAAFKACATELGIKLPERKVDKEQRQVIRSCMKTAGLEKRDQSDAAKTARAKCFADNNIVKPEYERPSKEQRQEIKACLAKKGFTRSKRT